jgi:NADH-quinone oxidoreductase subunit H
MIETIPIVYSVVRFLAAVLVFPGLLFVFVGALLNQWFMRKVFARMQNRIGPKYVGFSGVLQPFYDFFKLFSKESITPKYGRARLYALFIGIAIGSSIATLMFLPISPFKIHSPSDVVIFVYLGIWSTVALAFASLMLPNLFPSIGVSRLISLMFVYEPAWFFAILTPIVIVSKHSSGFSFSVLETIRNFSTLLSNPLYVALTAVSLAVAIVSLQCKVGLQPFDISEADTEILAGIYTEFSGVKLALASLFHDVEIFVGALLIVFLFLGGSLPFSLSFSLPVNTIAGVVMIVVKLLVVVFVLTAIRASSARYRVDQAVSFFFKYVWLFGLATLIIATFV